MVLNHPTRGTRQGRPGYLIWSILDGRTALRVPWRDLLTDGRNDHVRLETIRVALIDFERKLAEFRGQHSKQLPPMPTPNAFLVELDSTEFYAELARRLADYKMRERAKRAAEETGRITHP